MFEKIIDKINSAERVGIFTHVNPDGDALGSAYSLKLILCALGKRAEVFLSGAIEPRVLELIEQGEPTGLKPDDCDLFVAVDCADSKRLDEWVGVFGKCENTAAIDHHITHIPFADETVVRDISSACEVICGMYKEMNARLSLEAATDLYIGMATDTGSFKYSSVTGDTLRIAAELIDMGVDFAAISKKLFDTKSRGYLKLMSRAIDNMRFFAGGRIALLSLSNEDFKTAGVDEAEASPIVTLPGNIDGAAVGIYIRQRGDDECKISLRSSSGVDVSKIAAHFGGGGHVRAAGYSVKPEEKSAAIDALICEIEKQL